MPTSVKFLPVPRALRGQGGDAAQERFENRAECKRGLTSPAAEALLCGVVALCAHAQKEEWANRPE